jgi:hypothetical protein
MLYWYVQNFSKKTTDNNGHKSIFECNLKASINKSIFTYWLIFYPDSILSVHKWLIHKISMWYLWEAVLVVATEFILLNDLFANALFLLSNTQTGIKSIIHDSIALFSLKTFYHGGIRTRIFCSRGGCDVHAARAYVYFVSGKQGCRLWPCSKLCTVQNWTTASTGTDREIVFFNCVSFTYTKILFLVKCI